MFPDFPSWDSALERERLLVLGEKAITPELEPCYSSFFIKLNILSNNINLSKELC